MLKTALKFAAFAVVAASAAAPFAAAQSTTTTVAANPTSGAYGTPVTLSGAVTGGTSGAVRFPAGSLTFKDGSTSLGAAPITSDAFTKPGVVPLTSFAGTGATANATIAPIFGDLNGDGKIDFLLVSTTGFVVWLNNGDGTYTLKPAQAYVLKSPALIDYNGDGKTDVLEIVSGGLQVLLGDGTGVFAAPTAATAISTTGIPSVFPGYGVTALASVDLTGSGHMDVVLGYTGSCTEIPQCVIALSTATYRNQGNGTFGAPSVLTYASIANGQAYPISFQTGDFNGDGKPDIVQHNYIEEAGEEWADDADVLLNDGTGVLSVGQTNIFQGEGFGGGTGSFAVGDFGNRGKLDIVETADPRLQGANGPSGWVPHYSYVLIKGNGNGTFAAPVQIATWPTSSSSIAAVDLNADGKLDLVDSNGIALQGNGDLTFASPVSTFPSTPTNGPFVTTADMNGDGIADAVLENGTTAVPSTLLGNVNGSAALAPITTLAPGTHSITGVYPGTTGLTGSTSAPVTVTIAQQSSTLTATSSTAGVLVTLPVTLSVKVTAASGTPTGTVAFTLGNTTLGTATVDGSGNATINYTFTTVGPQTVTATYSGDANTAGSSTTVAATTLAPVTTLPSTGGTTLSTSQGGTATAAIAVASQAGFSGTVTLSCSGLPAGASCSFNPSSLTVVAGATVNSTLTVTPPPNTTSRNTPEGTLPLEKTGAVLAAGLLCSMGALFKRRRMAVGALLLVAMAFIGCLTGCSSSPTVAAKSYNFNVVATSGTSQTTTAYTLNVQ